MAHLDRHTRIRLVLLVATLILIVLGAAREESYPLARAAILIPALFLVVAVFLLGVPFLAMEHAEGKRVRWGAAIDFLEHNSILMTAWLVVVVAVAAVSWLHYDTMNTPEKVIFFSAAIIGLGTALLEWFRDALPDRRQEKYRETED